MGTLIEGPEGHQGRSRRPTVGADQSDSGPNGTRAVRSDSHPDTSGGGHRPVFGPVSALDRVTLQLGVVVAVVIALCSYAVSATSLYALGVAAGYSRWQAVAVPVAADGPAIYGMFRIVSRSRRGARGAGYGWLLVICGTAASVGGNVAHAHHDLVAQGIAAAIPLAVLAMLEGLKGDADEAARLSWPAGLDDSADPLDGPVASADRTDTITVRRADPPAGLPAGQATAVGGRQLLARSSNPAGGSVGQRLAAVYRGGRPDGQPWTARTLAEAASCGRSSAASFLQAHRQPQKEGP